MNQFIALDSFYPAGSNRTLGETVRISISYSAPSVCEAIASSTWKRSSAGVNASVNAFHMHRGLCREFADIIVHGSWLLDLTAREVASIKKLLKVVVFYAYLDNYHSNAQNYAFNISLSYDSVTGAFGKLV